MCEICSELRMAFGLTTYSDAARKDDLLDTIEDVSPFWSQEYLVRSQKIEIKSTLKRFLRNSGLYRFDSDQTKKAHAGLVVP